MNIGILGFGAIGGLIASQLLNGDNNIICLGSSRLNNFIKENGIFLRSNFYGEKRFFPISKLQNNESFDYYNQFDGVTASAYVYQSVTQQKFALQLLNTKNKIPKNFIRDFRL